MLSDMLYGITKRAVRIFSHKKYSPDLKVLGRENIPKEGPLIYSAVHLDDNKGPFLAGLAIDERIYAWANEEFFTKTAAYDNFFKYFNQENPDKKIMNCLFAYGISRLAPFVVNGVGFIPVPLRTNTRESYRSLIEKSVEIYSRGDSLLIFPDYSRDGNINEFGVNNRFQFGLSKIVIKILNTTDTERVQIPIVGIHDNNYTTLFGRSYEVTKEDINNLNLARAKKEITGNIQEGTNNLMEILWSNLSDEEKVHQSKQIWDFLK